MKTATVADLRNNFRCIAAWIEHGETVQILKRGRPFARLTGMGPARGAKAVAKPDIMAQLWEVWGDRILSKAEVHALREAEREGEEG